MGFDTILTPDVRPPGDRTAAEQLRLDIMAVHEADSLIDDDELTAITDFAARLCDTPVALIGMVESERLLFLAKEGLEIKETPRSVSFCQFAMDSDGIMEVFDTTADPRFADNILVTGEPFVRFYAGAPLSSEEGAGLGALCVVGFAPRPEGLSELQRHGLTVLAQAVMRRIRDRRVHIALKSSERRFEALSDAIPQMAWSTTADGAPDYFNARWYNFTGAREGEHDGQGWIEALHPDDRERAAAEWGEAVRNGEPYELEYRVRRYDGEYRWTLARGLPMRDADGVVVRWFGTNTDVHEQRNLLESRDLMSRELSHRIKNIFSVISGLIGLESRALPEIEEVAEDLRERIVSLGRAHDFVRPHGTRDEPSSLQAVLGELFAAYVGPDGSRVRMRGENPPLSPHAVTPVALLFHELATNAAKYGALSNEGGEVRLDIRREGDRMMFDWSERGGPKVTGEKAMSGFGSQLVDMSVRRQLRGDLEIEWADDGLKVRIVVPMASLN